MTNPISPNTTIAHYTIVSKIGAGGMGEVYRARDTRLDREFDVSPDSQRFLIGTVIGESTSPPPTVILNWTALVQK